MREYTEIPFHFVCIHTRNLDLDLFIFVIRQGCHIFYHGDSIWEWYPEEKQCALLVAGAGQVRSQWFVGGDLRTFVATDVLADVPDAAQNRTCDRFCDAAGQDPVHCYWPVHFLHDARCGRGLLA